MKKITVLSEKTRKAISESMMGKHNNPEYSPANARKPGVKVRCVELRCVFDSVYAASKMIGTTSANITHVLDGRQNTAGGFHWKREC